MGSLRFFILRPTISFMFAAQLTYVYNRMNLMCSADLSFFFFLPMASVWGPLPDKERARNCIECFAGKFISIGAVAKLPECEAMSPTSDWFTLLMSVPS